MRKKLLALHFKLLKLAAHLRFFHRVDELLTAAGEALTAAVAALMPDFKMWLRREEDWMDWVTKSDYTEQIAAADRELDRMLVGINAQVEAGLHSFGSAIVASAKSVHNMLKTYGNVSRESYDDEAGDVQELLKQFAGPYAQDVNNLGLGMWVQYLQMAYDTFNRLLRQREAEQGTKPSYMPEEVRRGIEKVYHQIADIIDANALVGESAEFAAFIDTLNPTIEHLNEEFHYTRINLSEPGLAFAVDVPDCVENGEPHTPPVTVYVCLKNKRPVKEPIKLEAGRHYITTYKNNVNVGKATIFIHGKGKYKGTISITFNIVSPLPTEQ
jgi:hypothetical protein